MHYTFHSWAPPSVLSRKLSTLFFLHDSNQLLTWYQPISSVLIATPTKTSCNAYDAMLFLNSTTVMANSWMWSSRHLFFLLLDLDISIFLRVEQLVRYHDHTILEAWLINWTDSGKITYNFPFYFENRLCNDALSRWLLHAIIYRQVTWALTSPCFALPFHQCSCC